MEFLRSILDRDKVSGILESVGYELNRQYKFRMREERTPSAVVNVDGTVHDFGSAFHGDVFKVLQETGMSFPEAKRFVMDQLGISSGTSVETHLVPVERKHRAAELTDKRYKEIVSFIVECDRSMCQTLRDPDYRKSALSIAPFWLYRDATKESIGRFKKFTTYDESQKSIVLPIRNYEGKLISYKHRYFSYENGKIVKWNTALETHPNKQCMVSLGASDPSTIYVVEGARDFLTAVLLGLDVVAIQTINYKQWNNHEIHFFKGRNVIFIPDIDPELKGLATMEILAEQIVEVSQSINIIDCTKIVHFQDIVCDDEKIDLSDVVKRWCEHIKNFSNNQNDAEVKTIHAFKSSLLYVGDIGVMLPEGEVF